MLVATLIPVLVLLGLAPPTRGGPDSIVVHFNPAPAHALALDLSGTNGGVGPYTMELDDPALVEAMRDLQVRSHRFPSGTTANGWNLDTGRMYANLRDGIWEIYNTLHPDGITLADYVALTQQLPDHHQQFVVNLLSRPDPKDPTGDTGIFMSEPWEYAMEATRQEPLLAAAIADGFDPRAVEFGNELYLPMYMGKPGEPGVPDVTDYLDRFDAFVPMLRGLLPDVPFGMPLPLHDRYRNIPDDESVGSLSQWIIPAELDYQAVLLHAYLVANKELGEYYDGNATLEQVMLTWLVSIDRGLASSIAYTDEFYPDRAVWVTEWGVLPGSLSLPEEGWKTLQNSTLLVMMSATMLVEQCRYAVIELGNAHPIMRILNPDDEGVFHRRPWGDLLAHVFGVIGTCDAVATTSVREDAAVPIITAPIDTGKIGWGGETADGLADALLRGNDGGWHWLAVNRTAAPLPVEVHLVDLGLEGAFLLDATRFFTEATLPDDTLDLLAEPVQETVPLAEPPDGVLAMTLPAMGFVDLRIRPRPAADVNGDGLVDVDDLLLVISAWGVCPDDAPCPADLDGDEIVGIDDLLLVIAGWS